MKKSLFLIYIVFHTFTSLLATIWNVGPGKQYNSPSKVSNLVKNNDTVNIDAAVYAQDVCFWRAHHLLLRGMNGRAHLKAEGRSAGQKAIWVIQGDSTIVENIEFSECTVPDKNGAGIRLEATHLVVRNCYFHNNEDGILGGDNINSNVLIEFSEFSNNGYGDGLSHNLYLNHIKTFTFRYNYSHDATRGHLVKSRAHNNYILYNRLSQENGNGSYEIDLPNGGYSVIMGNIIQQGPRSENGGMIAYGQEGLNNPIHHLYLSHNTIINERSSGTFIHLKAGTESFLLLNNVFAGPGTFVNGSATKMDEYGTIRNSNLASFNFENISSYNFTPTSSSPCFNRGYFSNIQFPMLTPEFQYQHPARYVNRNTELVNDVGAIEAHFLNAFSNPIKARYKEDYIIVNYVDWSNAGSREAWCGTKTYPGHNGTDFVLDGFLSMRKGIDINAVDNGIVTSIKDGLFDEETKVNASKGFGNYICIRHPGNYYTYYAHLKKNSIKVKLGDSVKRDQVIAQIGSSGNSTDPHLHFEFWWDSTTVIDPFKASCGNFTSFWEDQLAYDTTHQVWRSGMLEGLTSLDSLRFNDYQKTEFDIDKDYYATYWNLGYGLREGAKYSFQWYNQAGIKVWQVEDISASDFWYYYLWSNVDVKTLGVCENCEVRYLVNNEIKDKKYFKVKKTTNNIDPSSEEIIVTSESIRVPKGMEIVEVFNMMGQKVDVEVSDGSIYIKNLIGGIYFVKIRFIGKEINYKFFVS